MLRVWGVCVHQCRRSDQVPAVNVGSSGTPATPVLLGTAFKRVAYKAGPMIASNEAYRNRPDSLPVAYLKTSTDSLAQPMVWTGTGKKRGGRSELVAGDFEISFRPTNGSDWHTGNGSDWYFGIVNGNPQGTNNHFGEIKNAGTGFMVSGRRVWQRAVHMTHAYKNMQGDPEAHISTTVPNGEWVTIKRVAETGVLAVYITNKIDACRPVCRAGTFAGPSSSKCTSCPEGQFSKPGTNCEDHPRCTAGEFLAEATSKSAGTCKPCPEGTYQDSVQHRNPACKDHARCGPGQILSGVDAVNKAKAAVKKILWIVVWVSTAPAARIGAPYVGPQYVRRGERNRRDRHSLTTIRAALQP